MTQYDTYGSRHNNKQLRSTFKDNIIILINIRIPSKAYSVDGTLFD